MPRILIIDDDALVRSALRSALVSHGHSVLEAANGRQGLALCEAEIIDVLVTDIVMPDKDGFEVMAELRRNRHGMGPGPKVIAMSGGTYMRAARYLEIAGLMGAVAVLAKPFSAEALTAAVDAALALSREAVTDESGALVAQS